MQSGYRSLGWARNVGGAGKPTDFVPLHAGDRSFLFYWGGGAAKSPNHGDYAGPRSMLAFWMGGACFHYLPPPPIPYTPQADVGPGGLPHDRRLTRGRPFIDDDECLEFLRLWVEWNDIE